MTSFSSEGGEKVEAKDGGTQSGDGRNKKSLSTVDRLLRSERREHELRGRGGTKPETLLKKQIPLRSFREWNEQRPGFVEIDLVGHNGGLVQGEYLQTLDMTDIYSGWTEVQAVQNKAQVWVFAALKELRARLPFPLRGIDSDNGSEFINADRLQYCQQERLIFTRSRPYRKKTAMWSRRTTPWCGGMSAISVWLARNN